MSFYKCEFCGELNQPFKWVKSLWWKTIGWKLYDRKIKSTKEYVELFNQQDRVNFNRLVKLYYPKQKIEGVLIFKCDKHGRKFDNISRIRS